MALEETTTRYVTAGDMDPTVDSPERFRLFRLCDCPTCGGSGKGRSRVRPNGLRSNDRCRDCRGEGRIRQEVATCATPEAVGVAIVTLAREGEFEECQFGLLDSEGEKGQRWLILPFPTTARTASAAGRLLRSRR